MHFKEMKIKSKETKKSPIDFMPAGEMAARILHERALHLSKDEMASSENKTTVNYICFQLGKNESYGIPYHSAKEVIHNILPTKIPCLPDYIAGTINRHGNLIAIIDLKRFFQLSLSEYEKTAYIILAEGNGMTIGIMADNIEGSDSYVPTSLETPLSSGGNVKPEYIIGLHRGRTAIIQMDVILADLSKQLSNQL